MRVPVTNLYLGLRYSRNGVLDFKVTVLVEVKVRSQGAVRKGGLESFHYSSVQLKM